MAFFLQASYWGLQTFLGRCFLFQPASTCQKSLVLMVDLLSRDRVKGLPFTTSFQSALPQNLKGVHMLHKSRSGSRDRRKVKMQDSCWEENEEKSLIPPFSAGAAKQRSEIQRTPTDMGLLRRSRRHDIQPPEKPLNAKEWQELRTQLKLDTDFEVVMLRQMVKHKSSIDVAKSLMADVVLRNGDVRYNSLIVYLTLCIQQGQTAEFFDIYDIIKLKFKTLETAAYSVLIRGLSGTDRWREAILLLKEMKKFTVPSKGCYGHCIKAALSNQDIQLALELYHEMVAENIMPNLDVPQTFFDTSKGTQDDKFKKELLGMLLSFRENQVYPNEALMQSIKRWFESIPGEKWTGHLTSIENGCGCPVCNQVLETIELSEKEYNILKEKVMKDVMQGNNTFRNTTPQELERFQDFVKSRLPYDIVIDGLNVANSIKKLNKYEVLFDVISYFAQQNLRLLVLSRKHLMKGFQTWNGNALTAMQREVDFFFTADVTQDDPFLLYATLHSGNHCKFVTRDLLRDHKACFTETSIRHLFFKWQRGHQLMLSPLATNKIIFMPILNYDTVVQTTGETWHIPYDDQRVERYSYEVPRKWLCLQRK
ncbi:PREDICTED: mitochondrial ribonuclease P protein 3 isoform X1 [Crocodylus porosus]|uniref:mitochondrial ribonuclease P protein 3 isoform X1 n=1 Tax=Crocodylus porosus TaxID=8502 RepID=UPI00093BBD32|nr:PREDICTED: mitochondrial ribonuclease P protein 3 isoform X1 [Crocodylus porosus]